VRGAARLPATRSVVNNARRFHIHAVGKVLRRMVLSIVGSKALEGLTYDITKTQVSDLLTDIPTKLVHRTIQMLSYNSLVTTKQLRTDSFVATEDTLKFGINIFTMRRYISAVYAFIVYLSVRLSVCHTLVLYQNG